MVIGPKEALFAHELQADNVSWVAGEPPAQKFECQIKIRNLHLPAEATVTVLENGSICARFAGPQMSITAGQSAVMYAGDTVLGGGIIK